MGCLKLGRNQFFAGLGACPRIAIFSQIEAFVQFCRRHIVDIPRIKFTNNEELGEKCILGQAPRRGAVSEARAVFCYTAVRLCDMVGVDVCKFLGIGSSSVSRAVHRGEHLLLERPALSKKLDSALNKK